MYGQYVSTFSPGAEGYAVKNHLPSFAGVLGAQTISGQESDFKAPALVLAANLSYPRVPRYSTCDGGNVAVAHGLVSTTARDSELRALRFRTQTCGQGMLDPFDSISHANFASLCSRIASHKFLVSLSKFPVPHLYIGSCSLTCNYSTAPPRSDHTKQPRHIE